MGNCEVTTDRHNAGRSSIQFFLKTKDIVVVVVVVIVIIIIIITIIIIIQRKWNMKAKAITVIVITTGVISKSLRQYLSNISGKHEITELQRKAI